MASYSLFADDVRLRSPFLANLTIADHEEMWNFFALHSVVRRSYADGSRRCDLHYSRILLKLRVSSVLSLLLLQKAAPQEAQNQMQEKGTAEILALHQLERRAHFKHDIGALVAGIGSELLDVRDGVINSMTPEDVRRRFIEYFRNAEFSAWDDLQPPIVHVSSDGQMAWMIVRVRISYEEADTAGKKTVQQSVLAWMSAYEKRAGKWLLLAVTSTSAESKL